MQGPRRRPASPRRAPAAAPLAITVAIHRRPAITATRAHTGAGRPGSMRLHAQRRSAAKARPQRCQQGSGAWPRHPAAARPAETARASRRPQAAPRSRGSQTLFQGDRESTRRDTRLVGACNHKQGVEHRRRRSRQASYTKPRNRRIAHRRRCRAHHQGIGIRGRNGQRQPLSPARQTARTSSYADNSIVTTGSSEDVWKTRRSPASGGDSSQLMLVLDVAAAEVTSAAAPCSDVRHAGFDSDRAHLRFDAEHIAEGRAFQCSCPTALAPDRGLAHCPVVTVLGPSVAALKLPLVRARRRDHDPVNISPPSRR